MQVDAELAPLRHAKREEALRRVDDEVGVEARVLKEQVERLKAEAAESRKQLADLDQKVEREINVCLRNQRDRVKAAGQGYGRNRVWGGKPLSFRSSFPPVRSFEHSWPIRGCRQLPWMSMLTAGHSR